MSHVALKLRADAGNLRGDDLVWTEGMPDWVRADSVSGLIGVPGELAPPRIVAAPALAYAGFWLRAAAFAVDYLLLFSAIFVAFFAIGFVSALASGKAPELGFANAVGAVFFWLYFAGMESSGLQATLGKRLVGIQVTDLQGRRVNLARASGRHFGKIVSMLVLLLGFVMAGFTQRKQTLHDWMASCLVVRGRARGSKVPDHEAWAARRWGGGSAS